MSHIEINDDTFVLPPDGSPNRSGYMIQQDLGIIGTQRVFLHGANVDALIVALGGVPLSTLKAWAIETEAKEQEMMDGAWSMNMSPSHANRYSRAEGRRTMAERVIRRCESNDWTGEVDATLSNLLGNVEEGA